MKIKVTPEGRKGMYLVEKKDIIAWIKAEWKDDKIHNFLPANGPMIIGADWDVDAVIEEINRAERLAILIGGAQQNNYRHALSLIIDNQLKMFDIGEITKKDLQICTTQK